MKLIKLLALTAALSLAASTSARADDTTVKISDLNWIGPKAIAHVLKAVIEGPLGSEAVIVEGMSDQALIAAGMDKGDGSVDVYTELTMPNQQAIWDKYVEGNQTVDISPPYPTTQGLYIPSYMADRIKTVDDLKDPEIAAMFDKDGNGRGEYWPGDVAWKSTKIWQVKFKDYGLSELWEPEIVSDATFKSQLKTAYGNQKPIIFYNWTPEWIHAAYDLSLVGEPSYTEGCVDLRLDEEDWLDTSKFNCEFQDSTSYVAFSKSLEQRNPAVAKFLKQVQLDADLVNQWILKIGRDEMDPQDVAEEWVSNNMDTVNKWIN